VRTERRRTRETMSLAHRYHEIFLKKSARLEAWGHHAEWKQRNVDLPPFKLLQAPLPRLVLRAAALLRHQMKQSNVDVRRVGVDGPQYRCHHRRHDCVRCANDKAALTLGRLEWDGRGHHPFHTV